MKISPLSELRERQRRARHDERLMQILEHQARAERILRLRAEGLTMVEIGARVGLSRGRIWQILRAR